MSHRQYAAGAALALYLLLVAYAVLNPSADAASTSVGLVREVLERLDAPPRLVDAAELGSNVVLFVPIPVLVGLLGGPRSVPVWLVLGAAASGLIELTQRVLLAGRTPSLVDVAANTTGAVVGALVLQSLIAARDRSRVRSAGPKRPHGG